MAIENLRSNIEKEKELVRQALIVTTQLKSTAHQESERKLILRSRNSFLQQLKIVNNSIPKLLDSISPYRGLDDQKQHEKDLVQLNYSNKKSGGGGGVTINKKDETKFIKELSLNQEVISRLKKRGVKKEEKLPQFRGAGTYAKFSNRLFLSLSQSLLNKGQFSSLNLNLRKSNQPYLLTTYLSISFLSTALALIFGILVTLFLVFFKVGLDFPFIETVGFDILRVLRNSFIWIIVVPVITFISFISYPYAERRSIAGRINQELPFVAIHMSAIAGSGIEPTQIFKIIAFGDEYPDTKQELKKVINQVNIYGYDLITALKNTARETSSKKLSELLGGIASSISGGSELNEFLDKRAESLLFEYRLEREKHNKSAETFMDIYISIMIAAPMILMLLLVLISISGISVGLGIGALSFIVIAAVALINIIFLVFLHLNQPSY